MVSFCSRLGVGGTGASRSQLLLPTFQFDTKGVTACETMPSEGDPHFTILAESVMVGTDVSDGNGHGQIHGSTGVRAGQGWAMASSGAVVVPSFDGSSKRRGNDKPMCKSSIVREGVNSYYDAIRAIVVMMMTHAEEYTYACTRPTHDEWDEVRYTRPRMGRGTM